MEYDIEVGPVAQQRMCELAAGQRNAPLLAENGRVLQVGWQGRSCIVDAE
jgi:glutaredoxin 3